MEICLTEKDMKRCIISKNRISSRYMTTRYSCGYSIIKEGNVIMIRDEESGINRYELLDNNFDCFYLYKLIIGVIECNKFSPELKRWFIEQLDKIELELPGFVADPKGELIKQAVALIFAKKENLNSDDLRLFAYCKNLIGFNYRYSIHDELQKYN